MVSQENIDRQHESSSYRVFIGAIVFVFLVLTWYALTKVAVRVQYVRDNMRHWLLPILGWTLLLVIVFFVFLFFLNRRGKKEQWEKKQPKSQP